MSELSREDAIEKVKDMKDFIIREHFPNDVFVSHMNEAIKVLSARPHGEWIPCSERLPEEKGKYLCTTHYAIPPYHVFHPENDIYVDSVSVHNFDGKSFIDSVVAWMPLPEPYKRGDAE